MSDKIDFHLQGVSTYFYFIKMAHEFGLTTEEHNRLDARLAAIREEYDATREISRVNPTPPAQEEERTFVDAAIQRLSAFWDNFGKLFSSNPNPQVSPSHEGKVEMRILYDDEGGEWIKVININDMVELTPPACLGAESGVTAASLVSTQHKTRPTSHHTLSLPHSPHHRKRTLTRSMSEGFISSWRAETRREVDLLMEQAADEVTANLSLPMPPFTQVC